MGIGEQVKEGKSCFKNISQNRTQNHRIAGTDYN